MIVTMREPVDEFAKFFRKLRKDRGFGSTTLSEAIGKHRTYLGAWERDTKTKINREVLHVVSEHLKLSDAERHQLFALSNKRNLPEGLHANTTDIVQQVALNVHQALSEVPYVFPPDGLSDPAITAVQQCGAWVLCYYAVGLGFGPTKIRWPELVYRHRIVEKYPNETKIEIPEAITSRYFPKGDGATELTEPMAHAIGIAMAESLKTWYLSDLDRARSAAQGLKRWSLTDEAKIGPVITFIHHDVDQADFNIPGIRIGVATQAVHRQYINHLWEFACQREELDSFRSFPDRYEALDGMVYSSFIFAKGYLHSGKGADPVLLQTIRDALFVVRYCPWRSLAVLSHWLPVMRALGDETEELKALDGLDLSKLNPADNYHGQQILATLQREMLDKLELAEKKMARELNAPSLKPIKLQHLVRRDDKRKKRKAERKRKS